MATGAERKTQVATGEDEAGWKACWQHLIERGLDPHAVKLVVSDGTQGLLPAMAQYLSTAKLQRCTVHKIRGFARYLRYRELPDVEPETGQPLTEEQAKAQRRRHMSTEAHTIFEAPTHAEAEERLADFIARWKPLEPKAVKNFTWGLKRCFEFYAFDAALHPLIRSTNLLERFFREFRAKADEIGCFPNETGCLTIFRSSAKLAMSPLGTLVIQVGAASGGCPRP